MKLNNKIDYTEKQIAHIILSNITGVDYLTAKEVNLVIQDDVRALAAKYTGDNSVKENKKQKDRARTVGLDIIKEPTPAEIKNAAIRRFMDKTILIADKIESFKGFIDFAYRGVSSKFRKEVIEQWAAKNESTLSANELDVVNYVLGKMKAKQFVSTNIVLAMYGEKFVDEANNIIDEMLGIDENESENEQKAKTISK